MRTLGVLTWSAIKMFARNKQAFFFTFFFPVLLMTVLGILDFDKPTRINIGLVLNAPPTAQTKQFLEGLKQVPVFDIHEGLESDERTALTNDDRAVIFVVPYNLIPGPAKVTALTNAGQAQAAATAVNIVNGMLDKTALQLSGGENLFGMNTEEINTHHLKYIDFLLPGLIALSIMQMSVFSVAFVFVTYKEKGILKRLVATPMRPSVFVLSNVITRLMVSLLQTAVFVALGVFVFHAHVIGSYWLLFLIALFGSLMFLGLGFTVSGLASTIETVPPLANLLVFPMIFISNTFFSSDLLPNWVQNISKYLPLTFLSNSMRAVMTKGATFSEISHDIYWMIGWAVVLVVLANITFGFEEKRQ